jgi:hypothetical protein
MRASSGVGLLSLMTDHGICDNTSCHANKAVHSRLGNLSYTHTDTVHAGLQKSRDGAVGAEVSDRRRQIDTSSQVTIGGDQAATLTNDKKPNYLKAPSIFCVPRKGHDWGVSEQAGGLKGAAARQLYEILPGYVL